MKVRLVLCAAAGLALGFSQSIDVQAARALVGADLPARASLKGAPSPVPRPPMPKSLAQSARLRAR